MLLGIATCFCDVRKNLRRGFRKPCDRSMWAQKHELHFQVQVLGSENRFRGHLPVVDSLFPIPMAVRRLGFSLLTFLAVCSLFAVQPPNPLPPRRAAPLPACQLS